MLYCEKCNGRKGRVIDCRYVIDRGINALTVRRRRRCSQCNFRWTTVEVNKFKIEEFHIKIEKLKKSLKKYQTYENLRKISEYRRLTGED